MWAATVRRCPNRGYPRHHSHFGTRLQIARALNHAPYLICDPSTYPSCAGGNTPHSHLAYDLPQNQPQSQQQAQPQPQQQQHQQPQHQQPQQQQPDIISDHMLEYDSSRHNNYHAVSPVLSYDLSKNKQRSRSSSLRSHAYNLYSPPGAQSDDNDCADNPNEDMGVREEIEDDVRVELPYTRREHLHYQNQDDSLVVGGGRVVRRYQEYATARYDDHHDDISSVVGLSYQQRDITTAVPLYEDDPAVLAFSSSATEDDGPPFLLTRGGRLREVVRTLFVGALSLTLVTFVIMCFPWVSILNFIYFLC